MSEQVDVIASYYKSYENVGRNLTLCYLLLACAIMPGFRKLDHIYSSFVIEFFVEFYHLHKPQN